MYAVTISTQWRPRGLNQPVYRERLTIELNNPAPLCSANSPVYATLFSMVHTVSLGTGVARVAGGTFASRGRTPARRPGS